MSTNQELEENIQLLKELIKHLEQEKDNTLSLIIANLLQRITIIFAGVEQRLQTLESNQVTNNFPLPSLNKSE